jgi:hypothetical protein
MLSKRATTEPGWKIYLERSYDQVLTAKRFYFTMRRNPSLSLFVRTCINRVLLKLANNSEAHARTCPLIPQPNQKLDIEINSTSRYDGGLKKKQGLWEWRHQAYNQIQPRKNYWVQIKKCSCFLLWLGTCTDYTRASSPQQKQTTARVRPDPSSKDLEITAQVLVTSRPAQGSHTLKESFWEEQVLFPMNQFKMTNEKNAARFNFWWRTKSTEIWSGTRAGRSAPWTESASDSRADQCLGTAHCTASRNSTGSDRRQRERLKSACTAQTWNRK